MKKLFEKSCKMIEEEYKKLGHTLGYRFLLCPQKAFNERSRLLLLGLNPGGDRIIPEHPEYSCENGNAYFSEIWKGNQKGNDKLQIQVQLLYDAVKKKVGSSKSTREFSESDIVSAYFIPFRSKNIASLYKKNDSKQFSSIMWKNIFMQWQPESIICLGKDTQKEILSVLENCGYSVFSQKDIKSGWGDYTNTVSFVQKGEVKMFVGGLLHLSRFSIFGKPECDDGVKRFIDMIYIKQ